MPGQRTCVSKLSEGARLTLGSLQQVVVTDLHSRGLEFQFILFDKLFDAWQSKHTKRARLREPLSASGLLGSCEELHRHSLRTRRRGRSSCRAKQRAAGHCRGVLPPTGQVFLSLRKRYAAASSAFRGRVELFNCPGPGPPKVFFGAFTFGSIGGLVEATKLMEQHDRNCPSPGSSCKLQMRKVPGFSCIFGKHAGQGRITYMPCMPTRLLPWQNTCSAMTMVRVGQEAAI